MPLVRIDLPAGKSPGHRKAVGDIVHKAMTETINVPPDDKFQIITEHAPDGYNMTRNYLGIDYSADIIVIQITLNAGRTVEMKKALFKNLVDSLHADLGVRLQDVVINLVEVTKENWSFGNGEMQYGPKEV
jgi:4-oxalocrotonate tautomerase